MSKSLEINLKFLLYKSHLKGIILNRSRTCPQCRQMCEQDQIKKIYIDFVSDDDLASIRSAQTPEADANAEETIKLLLEHIDTLPKKKDEPDDGCEFCKSILDAFDELQIEKQKTEINAIEKARECDNLIAQNNNAKKRIEELQITIKANEDNLLELNERLDSLEKVMDEIQSENLRKNNMIRDNDIERKIIKQQVYELTTQLRDVTDKHTGMYQILQPILKGIWPLKLLKITAHLSQPIKRSYVHCVSLAPFCGDIEHWEYMIIPVIKKNKNSRKINLRQYFLNILINI